MRKVQGIGISDVKVRCISKTKVYATWRTMLCMVVGKHGGTPAGYTIDEAWLKLSNFKKWYDVQPLKDIPNYILDSYWLNCSQARHFSPETTTFLPPQLVHFMQKTNNQEQLLGIFKTDSGKYRAASGCTRIFASTSDMPSRASFVSMIDAHMDYLKFKIEILNHIRKTFVLDERLFVVMDLIVDKLQYHIDNRVVLEDLYDLFN